MAVPHRSAFPLGLRTAAAPFAASVAARVGRRVARPGAPRIAQVYRRARRAFTASAGTYVTFAPRIDMRFSALGRGAGVQPAALRLVPVVARTAARTISRAATDALVERCRARAIRDDGTSVSSRHAPTAHGASLTTDAVAPGVRPVPSVARVLAPRTPAVVDAATSHAAREWSARSTPAPRAPQLSPVEVNRLTDHIVQTIDRRIAAFRERQGRV